MQTVGMLESLTVIPESAVFALILAFFCLFLYLRFREMNLERILACMVLPTIFAFVLGFDAGLAMIAILMVALLVLTPLNSRVAAFVNEDAATQFDAYSKLDHKSARILRNRKFGVGMKRIVKSNGNTDDVFSCASVADGGVETALPEVDNEIQFASEPENASGILSIREALSDQYAGEKVDIVAEIKPHSKIGEHTVLRLEDDSGVMFARAKKSFTGLALITGQMRPDENFKSDMQIVKIKRFPQISHVVDLDVGTNVSFIAKVDYMYDDILKFEDGTGTIYGRTETGTPKGLCLISGRIEEEDGNLCVYVTADKSRKVLPARAERSNLREMADSFKEVYKKDGGAIDTVALEAPAPSCEQDEVIHIEESQTPQQENQINRSVVQSHPKNLKIRHKIKQKVVPKKDKASLSEYFRSRFEEQKRLLRKEAAEELPDGAVSDEEKKVLTALRKNEEQLLRTFREREEQVLEALAKQRKQAGAIKKTRVKTIRPIDVEHRKAIPLGLQRKVKQENQKVKLVKHGFKHFLGRKKPKDIHAINRDMARLERHGFKVKREKDKNTEI